MTMSELQPGEPGLQGVRRNICDWLGSAGDLLRNKVSDADVHDARREVKKSRAALRLLRSGIAAAAFDRENAALRDAARPLSAIRDAKVRLATLDGLVERDAPAAHSLPLERFRRGLRKERTQARRALTTALMNKQRKALHDVAARSERWRLQGDDWKILGAGIERVYRSGRKKFQAAHSRDDEHLHVWRKQVKYLWYQLQILQPLWPQLIGELADQTHKLGDLLGDDHDLAVLRQKIVAKESAVDPAGRDALLALLDRRRRRLQNKAFILGDRIFEAKPRQFGRRLSKYWQVWRTKSNSRH